MSRKQHIVYDVVISTLAVVAVMLGIIGISEELNRWQTILEKCILVVFSVDYFVRLCIAPQKTEFIKHNVCDLIAIIPLHTLFLGFKLVKVTNILRLTRIPRIFAFLYRPLRKANAFMNTNGFKYMVFIAGLMILTGGILIHFAEDMSIPDGIWWAFVTTTTVGYGDISPKTTYGRFIAMILMIVGIGLIGSLTSAITAYFFNNGQKKSISNLTIEMVKQKLDNFDSLTVDDVDTICCLLKSMKNNEK